MKDSPDFLIVIGASAGGLTALKKLVKDFEPGLNAAVCVVLHLPDISDTNFFVQQLRMNSTLICMEATHNLQIRKDHIYVAPVNKHLLVNGGKLILGNGARENRWRPSIDVLFRSAAAHYSTRSIGVILTGLLNDGVAGMSAIKRSKGKCIVLDPKEAEYPEMPEAVLANMKADYSIPLAEIVPVIKKLTQKKIKQQKAPADVLAESRIAEKAVIGIERVEPLGENTIYSCPDCGGNLGRSRIME